jgi:ATP-dependent exoDNAse (exonuclease V) beta subunit
VSHLLVGGKSFHEREEVETIRGALAAIEWPDDELSVFATLRGSLFAIDDETLLEYRHVHRSLHPFRVPADLSPEQQPVADALRLLGRLHRGRNYRPVGDTITQLLNATRAHVGFVLRPAGQQALANVLHVAELARQYEFGGGLSFRGFVEELRDQADGGQAAEAPILEEGSDGVRLMTVHKAKGLEFPVVILADLTCGMNRKDASRYLDAPRGLCALKIGGWAPHELHQHEAREVARDQAEGIRLAYVAATRARDLLVVPAVGDDQWDGGWFAPLNRALYPPVASRRNASGGPNCPAFKSKDSVLQRPDDEPAGNATVCPGLHELEGGYAVVWWDPRALKLDEKPAFGVRREDLIVKDVPRHVIADGRGHYDRWRLARDDARVAGATASMTVESARDWIARESAPVAGTDLVTVVGAGRGGDEARSGGIGFGLLVHGVLAQAPFGATRAALEELAAVEARVLDLSEIEASAAVLVVERVLAHDVLVRARAADVRGACRRETPVTLTLPDARLIEGIVDLAFEEGGEWTVVDYKTDREIAAAGEDRYRRQVALYASAIAQATGQPARGVLMRV